MIWSTIERSANGYYYINYCVYIEDITRLREDMDFMFECSNNLNVVDKIYGIQQQ